MDLFDLFAKLSLNSEDYEKGLDDAEKKAGSFGSKLGNGLKTASKVGVAALTAVATASGVMVKSVLSGAKEVAEYGDNIDKASQKMGISAQAYQEWDAILQHSGADISVLNRGMVTLAKAVDKNDDSFQALGLSQKEVSKMSQEELFAKTIEGLQNMEAGTERTVLAQKLLGGSAKQLGALLNTSAEDTEKMRQRVHELGGVMSDEAVKAAAAYQDSLQDFQTAMSGVKRGVMSDFLPSITGVMDGLTELFAGNSDKGIGLINQGVADFVGNLSQVLPKVLPVIGGVVMSIADAIMDNIDVIADAGIGLIEQLGKALINGLPKLIKAAVKIIKSLAQSISKNIKPILNAITEALVEIVRILGDPETISEIINIGAELLLALADGLVNAIPVLVEEVPTIITGFIDAISSNLPMILDVAVAIITTLVNGIVDNLPALMDATLEIIMKLVDALIDNVDELVDAAIKIIEALTNGLVKAIPILVEKAPEIIKKLAKALIDAAPDLWEAAKELINALVEGINKVWTVIIEQGAIIIDKIWEGIKNAFNSVVGWGKEVINKVVEGFDDAWETVKSIGMNIVNGIWQGIKSMASWLWDKVSGWVGGLVDDVKSFLGIASPSKVFAEIGKFSAEGIGVGFGKQFKSVSKDIQNKMSSLSDASVNLAANLSSDMDKSLFGDVSIKATSEPLVNSMDAISKKLDKVIDSMGFDVVLNDGVIAGRVDKLLGQTMLRKARGNA